MDKLLKDRLIKNAGLITEQRKNKSQTQPSERPLSQYPSSIPSPKWTSTSTTSVQKQQPPPNPKSKPKPQPQQPIDQTTQQSPPNPQTQQPQVRPRPKPRPRPQQEEPIPQQQSVGQTIKNVGSNLWRMIKRLPSAVRDKAWDKWKETQLSKDLSGIVSGLKDIKAIITAPPGTYAPVPEWQKYQDKNWYRRPRLPSQYNYGESAIQEINNLLTEISMINENDKLYYYYIQDERRQSDEEEVESGIGSVGTIEDLDADFNLSREELHNIKNLKSGQSASFKVRGNKHLIVRLNESIKEKEKKYKKEICFEDRIIQEDIDKMKLRLFLNEKIRPYGGARRIAGQRDILGHFTNPEMGAYEDIRAIRKEREKRGRIEWDMDNRRGKKAGESLCGFCPKTSGTFRQCSRCKTFACDECLKLDTKTGKRYCPECQKDMGKN